MLGERSVELRLRVERLERQRSDACLHRERDKVDVIDRQISEAVAVWTESLSETAEDRLRKAG